MRIEASLQRVRHKTLSFETQSLHLSSAANSTLKLNPYKTTAKVSTTRTRTISESKSRKKTIPLNLNPSAKKPMERLPRPRPCNPQINKHNISRIQWQDGRIRHQRGRCLHSLIHRTKGQSASSKSRKSRFYNSNTSEIAQHAKRLRTLKFRYAV